MIKAWRKWRDYKRWQSRERLLAALALAARRGDPEQAGWPLTQATGLPSGALYVALTQLEHRGEVLARWGERTEHGRRRYYRLPDHIDAALTELEG